MILMKYHTFFFRKLEKMMQNLLSAAVKIGTLRVNSLLAVTLSSADTLCKHSGLRLGATEGLALYQDMSVFRGTHAENI